MRKITEVKLYLFRRDSPQDI